MNGVCVSLMIDTKFVCVEVDVAPSSDVYQYIFAEFPETLCTREYIAVWRSWCKPNGKVVDH